MNWNRFKSTKPRSSRNIGSACTNLALLTAALHTCRAPVIRHSHYQIDSSSHLRWARYLLRRRLVHIQCKHCLYDTTSLVNNGVPIGHGVRHLSAGWVDAGRRETGRRLQRSRGACWRAGRVCWQRANTHLQGLDSGCYAGKIQAFSKELLGWIICSYVCSIPNHTLYIYLSKRPFPHDKLCSSIWFGKW